MFQQFEVAFPRVMELMCGGETFTEAVRQHHLVIDRGAFMRWIRKDAQRYGIFKESKEIRTEVWAGEMIRHAVGKDHEGNAVLEELDRSKVIIDTYKFLMKSDNKKEYGDTKAIEITQTISIRAALEAGQSRVDQIIDVDVIEDEIEAFRQLPEGTGDDRDEGDDD